MKTKTIRRVTGVIALVLMAGYLVFFIWMWPKLPETVPIHFNALGEADAFGGKNSLLIEPVIMIAMFILVSAVERFPSAWNFPVKITPENHKRQIRIGMGMLGALKILIVGLFIIAGLGSFFPGFPAWPLWLLMAGIACVIIIGIALSIRAR